MVDNDNDSDSDNDSDRDDDDHGHGHDHHHHHHHHNNNKQLQTLLRNSLKITQVFLSAKKTIQLFQLKDRKHFPPMLLIGKIVKTLLCLLHESFNPLESTLI